MAKCFFTGMEQPVEEMFILDITTARKTDQNLRHQAGVVEQIKVIKWKGCGGII